MDSRLVPGLWNRTCHTTYCLFPQWVWSLIYIPTATFASIFLLPVEAPGGYAPEYRGDPVCFHLLPIVVQPKPAETVYKRCTTQLIIGNNSNKSPKPIAALPVSLGPSTINAGQSSAIQSPSAIFMPDSSAEVLHISSVQPRMMSLDSGVSLNSALVCTHDAAPLPLAPLSILDGRRSSTMGCGAAQQGSSLLAAEHPYHMHAQQTRQGGRNTTK